MNISKNSASILVIDDNEGILKSLRFSLKHEFGEIETVRNPNLIPGLIATGKWDVILLDMNFSAGLRTGNEGIFWLREIMKTDSDAVVILITAYGDVELAVKGIKEGAIDFVVKPWDNDKLITSISAALRLRRTRLQVKNLTNKQNELQKDISREFGKMLGRSDAFMEVMETIKKVACTDANILVLGENGTGKELVAREIHRLSPRSENAFVSVDMASLPETLIESELFGHVKGAFTDAKESRTGRFESASGGTLFLDEIGNIPYSVQSKLLTVLQNRQLSPVGSNRIVKVDIRLISATNKPIHSMITDNLFREDLLYRINTIEITLPPLRERGEDIILLAEYYLNQFAKKYDKPGLRLSSTAADKLMKYRWPGNIRELRHTIEKTVILSNGQHLQADDFYFSLGDDEMDGASESLNLEIIEKAAIRKALKKYQGNISQTANELGITRKTLYTKMEKYGL